MSLQDLSNYHGLIKLNLVLFIDDILYDTILFKVNELSNDLVEIIPLFYCDSIETSDDEGVLIFETYKIIVPKDYNGLIHFKSEIDSEDCLFAVSFSNNSTIVLIYNNLLENVENKSITVKYYMDNELVYTFSGISDEFGYNQHQVPSEIVFNDLEVIV